MKEDELIRAIKKEPRLFCRIFDAHYQTIFNYCYKVTRNFELAKDLSSETFLKAYLKIGDFKWTGASIRSWLYSIAINEIRLYFRSGKYRPKLLDNSGIADYLAAKTITPNDESMAAQQESERYLQFIKAQEIIKTLPDHYREALSLKYFENLTIKEISQVLKKPEGTVKSLLSRGISRIKARW